MRILFLESGNLWPHTLPQGFRDLGHDILISGPLNNENLPRMIGEFEPDFIITIGWGPEHTTEKQNLVRKCLDKSKVPLIYWAVEDATFTEEFTLPLIRRMRPNYVFTLCPETAAFYNKIGIKSSVLNFGYHPSVHKPVKPDFNYFASVAVVANAYPDVLDRYPDHYRKTSLDTLIRPFLEKDIRVDFWGDNWDLMNSYFEMEIPEDWIHKRIDYKNANLIYNTATIIIGLQNYSHIVTQRTFEILGSGGFLLTMDTPGVNHLFTPGEDLIVSSTPEKTLELFEYYITRQEERLKVIDNAKRKVFEHSYTERAKNILEVLHEEGIINESPLLTGKGLGSFSIYNDLSRDEYLTHIVVPGDTLSGISRKFGVTIGHIMELNYLNSDLIRVGEILKIEKK